MLTVSMLWKAYMTAKKTTEPIWKQAPKIPTSRPRICSGAISAIYCELLISADPKPSKNRPAMKTLRFVARPCIKLATMTIAFPAKLTARRP